MNNVVIFGAGYVGLAMAALISLKHNVKIVDVDPSKVEKINRRASPIKDQKIENFFKEKELFLEAISPDELSLEGVDLVLLALPTNYDETTNSFDTSILDQTLSRLANSGYDGSVVIKSTLPIGYTDRSREKFGLKKLFFSPEFLREGKALEDNLNPSRIVVGAAHHEANEFAEMMRSLANKKHVPVVKTDNSTAEAIKLASNTYLAMRVAFFNEIDSMALGQGLDASALIEGISADPRIGDGYNNPSFGYGGYCLPKDTMQMRSTLAVYGIEAPLINSIPNSNGARLDEIAKVLIGQPIQRVGIYGLAMKQGSDNARASSSSALASHLLNLGFDVVVFDLGNHLTEQGDFEVSEDFEDFCNRVELIFANRWDDRLKFSKVKVISRDIYNEN